MTGFIEAYTIGWVPAEGIFLFGNLLTLMHDQDYYMPEYNQDSTCEKQMQRQELEHTKLLISDLLSWAHLILALQKNLLRMIYSGPIKTLVGMIER